MGAGPDQKLKAFWKKKKLANNPQVQPKTLASGKYAERIEIWSNEKLIVTVELTHNDDGNKTVSLNCELAEWILHGIEAAGYKIVK